MRVTVFGAAGNAGSRIVSEALGRGHEVTAVVRDSARFAQLPARVTPRVGDASRAAEVRALAVGQDVVIGATRPPQGQEDELAAAARGLLAGLTGTGVRLLVVGGAGSLVVPGSGGRLLVDDPAYVPPAWRHVALGSQRQLEVFRAAADATDATGTASSATDVPGTDVDWAYVSPPAILEPGERTGRYRTGHDEVLTGPDGLSRISMEDLAIALLDEVERPRHHRTRFTLVAD
ncbi:NAD(P)H-binding protein [Streptomyces sp. NPDC005955]|uniref:NAD(P)-dependent oxidoreductase n=1 Tax=Streptomyces sp. NPDC005955 TaxID=3364738 RepID=UPI0036921A6A